MSDLIDREKAIDFLGEEPEVWYGEPEEYAAREQWRADVSAIKAVPSAEPHWIPVGERLPEDEGWYLVTDDSGGVLWLEVEYYNPEFGLKPFCTVQNPVAWMRCPNPYGGEQE